LNREAKDILAWAYDFGIDLSEPQVHLLIIHVNQLWKWNKKINLTGLSSRERIMKELVLDSLIPCLFLPDKGSLLDVGSGAGFPGIPIKILKKDLTVHLIEANSKKVSFLKHVIRLSQLRDIEVVKGRIEKDKNLIRPQGYNIISARALAHLPQALTWCAPNLTAGGLLMSFQGSQFENALRASSDVMEKEQIFLSTVFPYKLPGKEPQRHLLIFMKRASSVSADLPFTEA
jgi:16S rRNA (guanine527-N7)-methyltransferase